MHSQGNFEESGGYRVLCGVDSQLAVAELCTNRDRIALRLATRLRNRHSEGEVVEGS